jgi:tetratricopeptide (TPR) repeat protein
MQTSISVLPQRLGLDARALIEQGRHREAAGLLEQLVLIDPNDTVSWRELGECYCALQDKPAAWRAFSRARELSPNDSHTLNDIGVMLFNDQRYEDALGLLCGAITSDPDFGDARLNLCAVFGRVTLKDQRRCLNSSLLVQQLRWASASVPDEQRSSLLSENLKLRESLLNEFRDRHSESDIRIMLYSPTVGMGALHYIFESWQQCLEFMGIPTLLVPVGGDISSAVNLFKPSTILSLDCEAVWAGLNRDQLRAIANSGATLGLVSEFGENTSDADFYITFHLHPEQDDKIAAWHKRVISLPFAFNPFIHHAYPARTLWDYAFVGTNSPFKVQETNDFLVPIVSAYEGILAGTGWPGRFDNLTQEESGLLYSFAAICPNFHLRAQIETSNEVNERTHVIAACGGFQLVDTPAALREMYSEDEIASAVSPAEYQKLFKYYLSQPELRHDMAIRSMRVAWKSHSQFHRLGKLIDFLQTM